ncbi:MAG TPA: oligoendopeptidase F, partial [Verrucomicrobiae bacterium]|nr:oligoendopeptidase F [Verrucomicrobiae bacterium]
MSPDTAAVAADAAIGPMPEWDLRDLYPAPDSPALAADLKRAAAEAKVFRQRYQGKLPGIDGTALGGAVKSYEALQDV